MIGFLRGKAVSVKNDYVLLDVQGVGYRVFIAGNMRQKIHLNKEIQLFTYMNVYQDGITLYGFAAEKEYDLFCQLIAVSGIGPKVALGILSAITVEDLCQAIQNKQLTMLTKLPGIGKKSAERLVLELKDKLTFIDDGAAEFTLGTIKAADDNMLAEAAAALETLGYSQSEIFAVLKQLNNCKTTEEMIKLALKKLSGM